jgi:hypothetical protein
MTVAATEEGAEPTVYRIRLGNKNPAGVNYYALFGDDEDTIYVITNGTGLDNNVLDLVTTPPFVADPTPTPVPVLTVPGRIFGAIPATDFRRLTVTNNVTGESLAIALDETNTWIEENAAEGSPAIEPMLMSVLVNYFIGLNAVDGITTDNLEPLGLTEPVYTITGDTASGQTYTLRVGASDPTGSRVYGLVDNFTEVVVLEADLVNILTGLIEQPPYVVEPIIEATAEVTPEIAPEATAEATENSN